MTSNLFVDVEQGQMWREELCPGAVVLRGFALHRRARVDRGLPTLRRLPPSRLRKLEGAARKHLGRIGDWNGRGEC